MKKSLSQILRDQTGLAGVDFAEMQKACLDQDCSLGTLLTERGIIEESELLAIYRRIFNLPLWSQLPLDDLDTQFTTKISSTFLKNNALVPLSSSAATDDEKAGEKREGDTSTRAVAKTTIAVNDPTRFQCIDDLARLLGINDYELVLATRSAILEAINLAYDFGRDSAEQLVQDIEDTGRTIIDEIEESHDLLDDLNDAPIIKLVNHILAQSVKARASDIHIEPYQARFKVRYRVDGILYDLMSPPKWIQLALISRIKVMAKMNIAEKRLPQDGRMDVVVGDQEIDVRVSTVPTTFGERMVLRLLNKSGALLQLSELGLSATSLELVQTLVASPNGIILVTGPTGSGKTTSLYAVLSSINTPDINIITIEDPVEYQIKGISQIQANPKIDLTFAKGLRSIVRQDPDVILVGEIRDQETAEIAVQSALTGHLVFSTLHTNDSASAITRLVDIGVEPFLISSSVVAVIAQRLVRVLCEACKQAYTPEPATLASLGLQPDQIGAARFFKAHGCDACFQTGYRGRDGIFEIMVMSEQLKSQVLQTYDANRIMQTAVSEGMITLKHSGIRKILQGITTFEEIWRVTQQ